jgi:PAS domain S-box-containing protein
VSKTGKVEYFPDAKYQDNRDIGSWRENWVIKLPNDNIAAIYNDITKRKKAEDALNATFEVLERVGEGIDAGLAVIGKDYRVVWANKRLMDLGVASNTKCYQTFNRSETVCVECGAKKIFEQNATLDVREFKTVNSKSETTWIELRVTPLKDKEGKVIAALELAVPISKRKKAENELKEKESKYRNIFNSSEVGMFRSRLDGSELLDFNEKYLTILGLTREEMAGKQFAIFWADPFEWQEIVQLLQTKGFIKDFECKMLNKQNDVRICLTSIKLYPLDGVIEGSIIDITESKKAKQSLMESEEKFRTLAEESPNMIFINYEGQVVYANKKCVEITGYSKEEFYSPNFNFLWLYAPEFVEVVKSAYDKHMEGEKVPTYEYVLITKDCKRINAIINTSLIDYKGKKAVLGIVTDITSRKRAEESLAKSEEKYKNYMENSPVAFFVVNSEGKYEQVNEAACNLLGYSKNELLEMTIVNILFEKDVSLGLKQFASLKETGKSLLEIALKKKDGTPVYIILNATKLPDGKLMAFCENISERKKSEKKLEENSRRIELMNAKLHVVGGLTRHDVGNKLVVVNSNLFLLRKLIGDKPELTKYIDAINSALESADRILEFSRSFERIGAEVPSKENVFECFSQAVALFPNLGSVKVVNECGGLIVMADSLLRQVFYNFIDNSLKHGEKVSKIRLHYSKDSELLKLFYEDNGVGVSEVNKSKIFNAGFTTGRSSGLGLSLIKEVIEFYGWTITEDGEAGKGAKFVISIPLSLFSGVEKWSS